MGFIARNLTTNKVYYSKGANKISYLIGCNAQTITKLHQINTKINLLRGGLYQKPMI